MAVAQGAVDLARTLRSSAGLRTRQPLATAWIALPDRGLAIDDELLRLIADEINVKDGRRSSTTSPTLVERRVKPLLPKIGKRLGSAIPAVMAAARRGEVDVRGRRVGDAGRRDAGAGRGRDPGHAPARHGGRRPRRPGRGPRHRADARAARRGRRPRAGPRRSRTCAARPGSSSTTGSTCGPASVPEAVAAHLPARRRRHARRRSHAATPPPTPRGRPSSSTAARSRSPSVATAGSAR